MTSLKRIAPIQFLIYLLLIQKLSATTWTTKAGGNWNTASVWQGGIAPPAISADTFVITHDIYLTSNLTFNSNALLLIDSMGGLCGHYKMKVSSGASLIKYGTLDLDTLAIPGGAVNCYLPGSVILTMYGVVSGNGAQFNNHGCSLKVGPWFTCVFGDVPNSIETFDTTGFTLFPNPCRSTFTIKTTTTYKETSCTIYNINGQVVYQAAMQTYSQIDKNTITINSDLPEDMYTIYLRDGTRVTHQRLVIIK
jgi:hypothetical protein